MFAILHLLKPNLVMFILIDKYKPFMYNGTIANIQIKAYKINENF